VTGSDEPGGAGQSPPLTPERWSAIDAILQGALARTPTERPAFLAEECAGDAALRREVESLLAVADTADDFLERPATEDASALEAVALASLSHALAGRYAVEHELGRGGMATVYLARDLRHKRLVALKVLHPALGTLVGPSHFEHEIETAAGLSHPHILPLHDSGAAAGLLYYVMPYVAGASLRERLQRERSLAVSDALRIVREVAGALDYAHRHGVVHRDIKPENILLAEDGHALVADFGIARALQHVTADATATAQAGAGAALPNDTLDTLSRWGTVVGTPAYMSPEQALGRQDIDGRSDGYSLGCMAFELLAGARPFAGSIADQLARRPTQEPPSLGALRPDLPPAVDAVVTRALAPAAAQRFASASAFAQALADALTVPRQEVPPGGASASAARGNRALTGGRRLARGAFALAALALVVGGGTVLLRAREREEPRRRAIEGVARARPAEPAAVDPQAFDLYVKGTRARYGGALEPKPAEYFARAIQKDSTYAPAYAGLALEHMFDGDRPQARILANKALALDPTLAEAHMVLGLIRQFLDWDWAGAEAALREAIRLNEGYAEAHLELSMLLTRRGRFEEAIREAQRTLYMAPMAARFEIGIGEVYLYSGRYDDALTATNRALAIDSSNGGAYLVRAYAYSEQQRYAKASEAAAKCIALGCDVHGRALLGYLHARSGRRAQALTIVDTLQARWQKAQGRRTKPDIAIGIAQVYAGLGEHEPALTWLERGVGDAMYSAYLAVDPTFRSLHAEPRFQALLKRVRLAQ